MVSMDNMKIGQSFIVVIDGMKEPVKIKNIKDKEEIEVEYFTGFKDTYKYSDLHDVHDLDIKDLSVLHIPILSDFVVLHQNGVHTLWKVLTNFRSYNAPIYKDAIEACHMENLLKISFPAYDNKGNRLSDDYAALIRKEPAEINDMSYFWKLVQLKRFIAEEEEE